MATLTDADQSLQIAGIAHLFYGDVDAKEMDVSKFIFTKPSTYGDWAWLGDISSENVIEADTDGGEKTSKRTHDRTNVRTATSAKTTTLTINSVAINADSLRLGYDAELDSGRGMYLVPEGSPASKKSLMIVIEDETAAGGLRSGFYFPSTSITGEFPKLNIEEFTELPLSVVLQPSLTQNDAKGRPLLYGVIKPKAFSAGLGV